MFLRGGGGGVSGQGRKTFLNFLNKKFYQLINKNFILMDLTIKKNLYYQYLTILYSIIYYLEFF